jgi:glycosyltransferase involved in cell wall biosynthesis
MAVLGAIVRGDLGSGLQSQSYNLTRMLKPVRLLYVDSTSFNKAEQHPELYKGFPMQVSHGFPTNLDSARFMRGLTHLITAETIYNPKMYEIAKLHRCRVYTQLNWEFLDHLVNPRLPKPHTWLMPSHWHLEEMQQLFPNTVYLPPPVFLSDFKDARTMNLARSGPRRFVHIMGKVASHDRNGTHDLIDSLKYSTADFQLIIRSQYPVPEYSTSDHRVRWEIGNIKSQNDMYKDFDAMIMPRRYGGLCLPMNEALASALPVVMPDINPNNAILEKNWLVPAERTHDFMARTRIDVHRSDIIALGKKIDWLAEMTDDELSTQKVIALDLAMTHFSSDTLRPKYLELMDL